LKILPFFPPFLSPFFSCELGRFSMHLIRKSPFFFASFSPIQRGIFMACSRSEFEISALGIVAATTVSKGKENL
jgi:hypothetical protein